jgi:hypothetical protein
MTGQHPMIAFDLAQTHQDAMLQQSDAKRLNELAVEHSVDASSLRRHLGLTLVRLGERLATRRERLTTVGAAGDRAISAGVLRLSR